MPFLEDLSNSFLDQIGIAENKTRSLDTNIGGVNIPYAALGGFAKNIDRSAQRSYTESGTIQGIKPRISQILIQEPDVTVVVKKRMFSSLSENYRTDLMDADEKLFIRASKKLFEQKCEVIAAYERLSKIERIVAENGSVGDFALPLVFSAIDSINAFKPNLIDEKTRQKLETIRKVKYLSYPNFITTWINDKQISYASNTGEGNGTFELTLVNTFNCTNSTKLGGGSASLGIEDPYSLMIISNDDIDRAISEAASRADQNNFLRISEKQLEQATQDLRLKLNELRMSRGVSRIEFLVNEQSLLFKKVRAIIEEEGREIEFTFEGGNFGINLLDPSTSPVKLDPSAFEGPNGLSQEPPAQVSFLGLDISSSEADIFKQIISNLYTSIGLRETTKSEITKFNERTNLVRRKMRLHFGNKSIIQPLDVVSIFVSSKTGVDRKVIQGMNATYKGQSLTSKLNSTIGDVNSAFSDLKALFGKNDGIEDSWIEIEKNSIAGPEFPLWLYNLLRNDFTRQAAGTCVFSGLVGNAVHSYNGGRYRLTVTLSDNSEYFKLGQVNVNPSSSVYNGALYDPLTPFDLKFDLATGFSETKDGLPPWLNENINRFDSGLLRYKAGKNVGQKATKENYNNSSEIEKISSAFFRKKFNNPDGLIYRWKEGIGSLVLFGPGGSYGLGSLPSESSQKITTSPYAGQDAMNVISLLVTGEPYNFNNFIRSAIKSDSSFRDPYTNNRNSASFLKALLGEISSTNATWGNFTPFKELEINDKTYKFLASGQFDIEQSNQKLSVLIKERAKKFDLLTEAVSQFNNVPQFYQDEALLSKVTVDPTTQSLTEQIIELDRQIELERTTFTETLNQALEQSKTLVIAGDDISFNPSIMNVGNVRRQSELARARTQLRKRLNYLTKRRLWKVKANEDPNLFIVDDSYDKNYDLQVFEEALGNLETFNSSYRNVFDSLGDIARLLQFEIFADSQGHIRARAPKYNRMPSSVFEKMINDSLTKGIKIFPEFLTSLFVNQVEGLTDQLEIVEDEIRIRAAAIGFITDDNIKNKFDIDLLSANISNGTIAGSDFRKLFYESDPERKEREINRALEPISQSLNTNLEKRKHFNINKQLQISLDNKFGNNASQKNITDRISVIAQRLKRRTNSPNLLSFTDILSTNSTQRLNQSDVIKVTSDIATYESERQSLIKSLSNAISNLKQGNAANNNPKMVLYTNLLKGNNKEEFPELLESMIEDESYDDYGPGSGNRYIISGEKLISFELRERPPDRTIVQVNGKLGKALVREPSGLEIGQGGNGFSTAFAVDYDMWRLYGFRQAGSINAPYFENPYTQCAPYAVYQLNMEREKIFTASATVVGNEYIQPGEVYYIEDRDLLFYTESISHSFTYGSEFRTTLTLTYGHNPGEYIPTTLDIIGKGLYTNRNKAHLVRQDRFQPADDSLSVGALLVDSVGFPTGASALKALVTGTFAKQNIDVLKNIAIALAGYTSSSTTGRRMILEIRHYKTNDISPRVSILNAANAVIGWLTNPSQVALDDGNVLLPAIDKPEFVVSKDSPTIRLVNLDEDGKDGDVTPSPSQRAWDLFTDYYLNYIGGAVDSSEGPGALGKPGKEAFFNVVLDVWIRFVEQPPGIIQPSSSISEDQNKINEKYDKLKKQFVKSQISDIQSSLPQSIDDVGSSIS
jgi:hypothetical protein